VWKLDRLARSMKQLIETIESARTGGRIGWKRTLGYYGNRIFEG
jgi:hypothetical protein